LEGASPQPEQPALLQPKPLKDLQTMSTTKILAFAALTLGALATGPVHAQAVVGTGYGTHVESSTAGNCPSFCTGSEFADASDGGEFQQSAMASESTYGITRGSVTFASGQSYLPELKAYATAAVGKRASTTAFAAQLFTFTGTDARTVTLQVDLTGSVFNNASGYANNTIGAQMAVVRGADLPWYPSFGTLIYEFVSPENRLAVGEAFINTPGVTLAQTSLTFDLMPGDSFYVVTQMSASSQNGVADAEHTLKMNFDNPAGLLAVSAVPEMGTAWMALAGLLVFGFGAQRRRAKI
jgi:hypothetical protein